MSYVVAVAIVPKPEHRAEFRDEMIANATASREQERGCRQFDVCESADGGEIFLYEIYDDEAAFQEHLKTEHYKRFNARTTPWLTEKRILKYRRISPER